MLILLILPLSSALIDVQDTEIRLEDRQGQLVNWSITAQTFSKLDVQQYNVTFNNTNIYLNVRDIGGDKVYDAYPVNLTNRTKIINYTTNSNFFQAVFSRVDRHLPVTANRTVANGTAYISYVFSQDAQINDTVQTGVVAGSEIQQVKYNVTPEIAMTNCSASSASQTVALNISYFDEVNKSDISAAAGSNFNLQLNNDTTKTFGFNVDENHTHQYCIFPSYANYTVNDARIDYYDPGNYYLARTYEFTNESYSNDTDQLDLYMLSYTLGTEVIFKVKNAANIPQQNVTVRVQRYDAATDSYTTVSSKITDASGLASDYLKTTTVYYKFTLLDGSTVLRVFSPQTIICESSPCYKILRISTSLAEDYWDYLQGIAYNCDYDDTTKFLTCDVNDVSGIASEYCLATQTLEFGGYTNFSQVCTTSSSSTLQANLTVPDQNNKTVRYELYVFGSPKQYLEIGELRLSGLAIWGIAGVFAALLLILTVSFMGLWSPGMAVIFAFIGLVSSWLLGLIQLALGSLVGIGIVAGMIAYKVRA